MRMCRVLNISILVWVFILGSTACGKIDNNKPGQEPEPAPVVKKDKITILSNPSTMPQEGGEASISFEASSSWTASVTSTAKDWLSISAASGTSENGTIKVSLKPNDSFDERKGIVTIICGKATANVEIGQKQKDAITVTPNKIEVVPEGGEVKIEVKSNIDWQVSVDDICKDWISVVSTKALTAHSIILDVAANDGINNREGKISITNGSLEETVTICQLNNSADWTLSVSFTRTGNMAVTNLLAIMPVAVTNEYQTIADLQISGGALCNANLTNKILINDFSPFTGTQKNISYSLKYVPKKVKIDFEKNDKKNVYGSTSPDEYLGDQAPYIVLSNPEIKSIGDKLWLESGEDIIKYAKICYEYVAENFKYINTTTLLTLDEVLAQKGGECGDFTSLFVNLMRYKGIPARHNFGVYLKEDCHVWPDFYHEDYGWIPVDPTYKHDDPSGDYFGNYNGGLVITCQGLADYSCTYSGKYYTFTNFPLQIYAYWYYYSSGTGSIEASWSVSK